MNKTIAAIYYSANDKEIILTKEGKHHLEAHPDVIELLETAVSKFVIPEGAMSAEEGINLGRIVGVSNLVKILPVNPDQITTFAVRKARAHPSHVVLLREGEPCDTVTLSVKFDEELKKYILLTAYVGFPCPDEPFYFDDKSTPEFKEALDFWSSHALIYDKNIMSEPFQDTWSNLLQK